MIGSAGGIIWDWNGTLLDDTRMAVRTMNQMLKQRGLPALTVDHYKSVFTFPVKDYYQKIGFDFQAEPFEVPALEFIDLYNSQLKDCSLHFDTLKVLNHFSVGWGETVYSFGYGTGRFERLPEALSDRQLF